MSLGYDVVNRGTRHHQTFPQTLLAQPFVSGLYQWFQLIPIGTIATFMPGLTLLVVLPSGILMLSTITRTVDRSIAAPMLTAGARYSGWHGVTPKEKPPAYKASGLDINNRPEAAFDGYLTQYLMLYNTLGPKLTISDARIPQILEMRTPEAVK